MPEQSIQITQRVQSLDPPEESDREFIECPTCNEMIEVLIPRQKVAALKSADPAPMLPAPVFVIAPISGLAISSLVLGIVSVFLCITAIPGVICGHLSLLRIRTSNGGLGGKGLALAGLVTGYVALALWLVIGLPLLMSHLNAAH